MVRSYERGLSNVQELIDPTYKKLSDLEVPPYTQLVVWINLSDGHPFMVGAYSGKLPICETRAGRREAAAHAGVVAIGSSSFPCLICYFMIVLWTQSNMHLRKLLQVCTNPRWR